MKIPSAAFLGVVLLGGLIGWGLLMTTSPAKPLAPRFLPGDLVEFKGLGLRSVVERSYCGPLECTYDLRMHYGPREEFVPEVVLEPVGKSRGRGR